MSATVAVTGGAGYVGTHVVGELLRSGRHARVLDVLLHDQRDVADELRAQGAEILEGDVRDADARRRLLDGAEAVVHLAAIVGDPACARDPGLAREINIDATRALVDEARVAGARRFLFASTCSNYGRMTDPEVPIDEDGVLAPVSLYAEQKVEVEKMLLNGGGDLGDLQPTCMRFATVYGVSPRMRFDLTVNEFTRELWADRELEVFGEQFWRPYIHAHDAARGVVAVLDADDAQVAREVFNVGRSGENYRKLDIVEAIRKQTEKGTVSFVHRDEDPRDYKVSFDKIARTLGFTPERTVPDGIAEILAALDAGSFDDPDARRYRNID